MAGRALLSHARPIRPFSSLTFFSTIKTRPSTVTPAFVAWSGAGEIAEVPGVIRAVSNFKEVDSAPPALIPRSRYSPDRLRPATPECEPRGNSCRRCTTPRPSRRPRHCRDRIQSYKMCRMAASSALIGRSRTSGSDEIVCGLATGKARDIAASNTKALFMAGR